MSQRFTSKVRRGFQQLIERHLERHVEQAIALGTADGLKRSERLTAIEVAELRAAVAYIRENAETRHDAEPESEPDPATT